ncbi:Detected protein of unknown function [Hibiscus syriacus]|uniref:Uncharacterized protein n=1 Tax=Hibiscus syriacus TaxID=106335 RepID=A0A6A3B278_HIBSY|nr:Detected protein of unknown function [Hibiscus syriacus]
MDSFIFTLASGFVAVRVTRYTRNNDRDGCNQDPYRYRLPAATTAAKPFHVFRLRPWQPNRDQKQQLEEECQLWGVLRGTTAECAAVCCCFPCWIANLLVLVIYKVPAGLCCRAFRLKRRWKSQKKGLFGSRNGEDGELSNEGVVCVKDIVLDVKVCEEEDKALFELEEEMWEKFGGTGFWRSPPHTET